MRNLKFDSVLLFALLIPFVMTYRISPDTTPYWLFTLIFISLLCYLVLDLLKINENRYYLLKKILLWFIIFEVIGSAFISAIIVRHQTAPIYGVHDIILQLESAIRFFLDGINPYATTYFGTPLEQWHYSESAINPALYHFVMQPFYLIFSLPFYFISIIVFGFFDGRIPLYLLFLLTLILGSKVVKDNRNKLLFVTLLAFNPAMLPYTLEGRSDVFMFAFLFFGFYLLHRGKNFLGGIPIALAFVIKQSVWPLFPLYVLYLYFKTKDIKKTLLALISFGLTFFIIVIPFFLWNQKAYLDSTILYLTGSTPNSYPISGYGFSMLLKEAGFIKDINQYYPFTIWQLLICIPLIIILGKYLGKNNKVKRLILCYGILLFVFWYFSRYFNNSHLGFLSMIFITAYFWPES